jgi:hypothetical protein
VENHETLGRGVFDSKLVGRAPPPARFFEHDLTYYQGQMSVDRMTYANKNTLCEAHDDEARHRGANRQFYGWYTFPATKVRAIGLSVMPTPSDDSRNIWHAEVTVPNLDDIAKYANAIRLEAEWEPRPLGPKAQKDVEQATGK